MNIIIQGGLYGPEQFTIKAAHSYASLSYVTKVIISTWEGEEIGPQDLANPKIILLKNKKPPNPGPGNMNLQIVSSREAIKLCDYGIIMKTRSDQFLYKQSIGKWYRFFLEHQYEDTLQYRDGMQQKYKIFLIGNNKRFPFHPQDHIFWGHKQDLERLFSVPLWEEEPWTWQTEGVDFGEKLRCPIYLGAHYYKQFYPEVENFLANEKEYLLDGAPRYEEAMAFYTPIRDSIFRVFPRIELYWVKYRSGYWYSYEKEGEYYAD